MLDVGKLTAADGNEFRLMYPLRIRCISQPVHWCTIIARVTFNIKTIQTLGHLVQNINLNKRIIGGLKLGLGGVQRDPITVVAAQCSCRSRP